MLAFSSGWDRRRDRGPTSPRSTSFRPTLPPPRHSFTKPCEVAPGCRGCASGLRDLECYWVANHAFPDIISNGDRDCVSARAQVRVPRQDVEPRALRNLTTASGFVAPVDGEREIADRQILPGAAEDCQPLLFRVVDGSEENISLQVDGRFRGLKRQVCGIVGAVKIDFVN